MPTEGPSVLVRTRGTRRDAGEPECWAQRGGRGEVEGGAGGGCGKQAEPRGVGEFCDVGTCYRVASVLAADDQRGEEDVGFVDEVFFEEGGEEFGAAFEKEVGVFLIGEVA